MSDTFISREEQTLLISNDSLVLLGKALEPRPRKLIDPEVATNERIKNWGDDNNYPQWVLEQTKDVTLVEPILDWKSRALYSGGLAYGLLQVDENGNEVFKRIVDNEIEDWLMQTNINEYLQGATKNFYYYHNAMGQISMSRTGKKAVYLTSIDSTDWRFELKDKKGYINKVYVSPDWEKYRDMDKETLKFPLFDWFKTDLDDLMQANKQFCFPIQSKSPGRAYYQRAPWHVILSTWLPIARAIPEFKKAMLKNQLTIKYIIRVPEWWWEWKYRDWANKSEKERVKIIQEEKTSFEKFFKGDKQGNSLMITHRDSTHAKQYHKWEVEVIDDKVKTGMYIEDSQEADAHIFKNLQVDSTLFGNGTGKDRSGAGSGSDKRVAWNNYVLMTKPHQDLILNPLYLIAKLNGWNNRLAKGNSRLVWWMKNYQIARLDSGSEISDNTNTPSNEPITD